MNKLYHLSPQHPCKINIINSSLEIRKLRREFKQHYLNLELPDLAKQSKRCPVKLDYQITNK